MKVWVNSRTKTEDYTWRTDGKCSLSTPLSSVDDGYEKWKFEDCVPWFGLVAFQNDATLYFGNLITNREDSRGRPIFIHAALQAENSKDVLDLVGFVASLLVREEELLPKWTAFFSEVFDKGIVGAFPESSHSSPTASLQDSIGRFVYPREDALSRDSIARRLESSVNLATPLAVGTTGRGGKGIFERVCRSEKTWQTAFFSSTCSAKAELQVAVEPPSETGPNTRAVAAAIGGTVLLALLVAAIGPCSRKSGSGEAIRGTNVINRAESCGARLGNSGTNVAPSKGVTETKAPASGRGGGTNAPAIHVGPAPAAATNVPPQTAAMTNKAPSSNNQHADTK